MIYRLFVVLLLLVPCVYADGGLGNIRISKDPWTDEYIAHDDKSCGELLDLMKDYAIMYPEK